MPIVGSHLSRLKAAGEAVNVEGKWGLASWYPAARKAELNAKSKKRSNRGRPKKSKPTATKAETDQQPAPKAAAARFTPEQIEKMKALRAAGKKDGEIGKEFGLKPLDVFRALRSESKDAV